VTSKCVWQSFLVGLVLVITLLFLESFQLKSNRLEKVITGKVKIVIKNGCINEKELVKLHLTTNQLHMFLRQNNIASIDEIELATLESSGRLDYVLTEKARPVSKQDNEELHAAIEHLFEQLHGTRMPDTNEEPVVAIEKENLFTEVKQNQFPH